MNRAQKEKVVEELGQIFSEAGVIVVVHYQGLTVAEMSDLRRRMRDAGGRVRVAKNRLARIALEGKPVAGIERYLRGQTALAFSQDPVAAPKIVAEFAKQNDKLVIIGGALGETILDAEGVKALASLPSLDELRARLIGTIQAPAGKIARVLAAPASQLARVLQARADKEGAAA